MTSTDQPWRPEPGVTDHSGAPLDATRDFFAPPPPEVGPVASAWSTLARGQFVWPTWLRVALYAGLTLMAGGLVIHFTDPLIDTSAPDVWIPHAMVWAICAMAGLAALRLVKRPRSVHECSYVGRDGVAVLTLRGGRIVRPKHVLAFASADGLYRSDSHQYLQGAIYGGTSFSFSWCDATGRKLLGWRGGHTEKDRNPRRHSLHELAVAAERAWIDHRLCRAAADIANAGFTSFRAGAKAVIRLAPGVIEVARGNAAVHRLTRAHAPSFETHQGRLLIRTDDASVFGPRGSCNFAVSDVADVAVLMALVEPVFQAGAGNNTAPRYGTRAA